MVEKKEKTWADLRKESAEKLFASDRPVANDAKGIRTLANTIWLTTKDETQSKQEMLSNLALLSGMACSVMLEYARRLEEEDVLQF